MQVGTALARPEEPEPTKGRLLVLQYEEGRVSWSVVGCLVSWLGLEGMMREIREGIVEGGGLGDGLVTTLA